MKKKFCKLIISLIFVVVAFIASSLPAFADPLTGAMLGSWIASGFQLGGFAGLLPGSISDLTDISYSDLVPWGQLVSAAHAYVTVRDLVGSNNVQVELSPELSQAGTDRTYQFTYHYGLTPGSVVQIGQYYSYQGYVFNRPFSNNNFRGPALYAIDTTTGATGGGSVGACIASYNCNTRYCITQFQIGNYSSSSTLSKPNNGQQVSLNFNTNGTISFKDYSGSIVYGEASSAQSGISVPQKTFSASRSADSSIVNPDGKANTVTIPSSYLNNIPYTSGETINVEDIVRAILEAIAQAAANDDVEESDYIEPGPEPSTETVSDTPWASFTTWFDNYFSGWTESFGNIYEGIIDFQESFGDWVEDVASGWTEVFGDIYDTLAGWTEVFGDIYDGIIDGFGDIADILEGILDYVADIVQEIVNADANWVNGFITNFLSQFQDWFDALKQHVSIWHYVVEWLASIGTVFTFFFGVLSSTGYNFVLPIYACFAGTVVIAIYRRFGK